MNTQKLRVGYARVDITPMESVPLAGFGNTSKRMSRAVRDELYASCFAITDAQENTIILMSLDLQRGTARSADIVRSAMKQQFGIPEDHVFVSGTHTHAGPDEFNTAEPSIQRYLQLLDIRLPACAALAMSDRQEADMFIGDVETERMNFVKHYCHTAPDGTVKFFGDNFGTQVMDETTRHATQADPTVHIVKFVREGCKDLVLVNFRAHGLLCSGMKKYDVSADWMGGLRSAFEQRSNSLITYFQGAAGNQNPKSRILAENRTEDCVAYGRILANYVDEGMKNMHQVAPALIKTRQRKLERKANKPSAELLAHAQEVAALWQKTNDPAACNELGLPYGIRSPYHANALIGRSKMEDSAVLELNTVSLGELAFVIAPNELFDTNSVCVEDHAPYAKVLTVGYCNGMLGYIPSKFGFEYTCYESDCCRFHPGIGEDIQDNFLEMLWEMKEAAQ